jgi:hypothetical protein
VNPVAQSSSVTIHAALDVLPTGEVVSAGHATQAAIAVAAAVEEYVPGPQSVHSEEPVAFLYCPTAQGVHVLPADPVYPASHTQSVTSPDMPSVFEFGGHKLQFALSSGDHCPAGQKRHVSGPVAL